MASQWALLARLGCVSSSLCTATARELLLSLLSIWTHSYTLLPAHSLKVHSLQH